MLTVVVALVNEKVPMKESVVLSDWNVPCKTVAVAAAATVVETRPAGSNKKNKSDPTEMENPRKRV